MTPEDWFSICLIGAPTSRMFVRAKATPPPRLESCRAELMERPIIFFFFFFFFFYIFLLLFIIILWFSSALGDSAERIAGFTSVTEAGNMAS